jgi:hypothetical protein
MSETSSDLAGARALPTLDELAGAFRIEVYDKIGERRPLGDLIKGKRSVLIFTRHFCISN